MDGSSCATAIFITDCSKYLVRRVIRFLSQKGVIFNKIHCRLFQTYEPDVMNCYSNQFDYRKFCDETQRGSQRFHDQMDKGTDRNGIRRWHKKLIPRHQKCLELNDDYVEK